MELKFLGGLSPYKSIHVRVCGQRVELLNTVPT
jgi:hypothetical protein